MKLQYLSFIDTKYENQSYLLLTFKLAPVYTTLHKKVTTLLGWLLQIFGGSGGLVYRNTLQSGYLPSKLPSIAVCPCK